MNPCLLLGLLLACLGQSSLRAGEPPEISLPTSRSVRQIEGWTVRVDDRLFAAPHETLGRRALQLLEAKLVDITFVVDQQHLARLQTVPIVLDLNHGKLRAMQYHPSSAWLAAHGYATNLAKCVHICEAAAFVAPRQINEQPWVVLHELAHAYHDQVLGFEEPRIAQAYERFKLSGRGEQALLYDGTCTRHYGLTDPKEFFAEMTESYFGLNDFYPFNRAELITTEPETYELMRQVWGPVQTARPVLARQTAGVEQAALFCSRPITTLEQAAQILAGYRAELEAFRKTYGGTFPLPDEPFFLFGMGHRSKLIYRQGQLLSANTGQVLRRWPVRSEIILPADYQVLLETTDGKILNLREDQEAVWIQQPGACEAVAGTRCPVKLPSFADQRFAQVLRVLHQELLFNVTDHGPVPNLLVYPKPWYRDGAMMALALSQTGNLALLQPWIEGLRDPYDRNNAGETEADNLGQALFLVSLTGDKTHPVVNKVLAELPRFEVREVAGKWIKGRSDFAEHPAYQTKWLKYGLTALGLPDDYVVPKVQDSYSALFWMAYEDTYVKGNDAQDRDAYPYLGWACDHFHGTRKSPISNRDYPLTWEKEASQAHYDGMKVIAPVFTQQRLAAPHTWHAAEVFLYLTGRAARQ